MIRKFRSMLSALAFVLGEDADHYFQLDERTEVIMENALRDVEDHKIDDPEIRETLDLLALGSECVALAEVGNEAHYGYVVAHYTPTGEIVRFVAINTL